jgi:hypothetical protein
MAYTAETGSVGLAIQPVKGTFTEPTDFIKVTSVDLNPEGEKIVPDAEIGMDSFISDVYQGSYRIAGSLDAYVRPQAMGLLFYGALGKYTSSGSLGNGAYMHNFTASGTLPWLSIKKNVSTNIETFDYTDCKIEGFTLDINASEPCTASFDIVGISDKVGSTPTPTYETAPILIASKATINIGGTAVSVKNCSIEYKNNLDNEDYRVGTRFLGDITEKRRDLDIKLDIVLDTTSKLYRKSFYGTASATTAGFDVYADRLDVIIDSPTVIGTSVLTHKILIQIKNCVFMAAPVPASGDDLVVIPLELKATKIASQNMMEIHVWNGKASY